MKLFMLDFECQRCAHAFEDLLPHDTRETACPKCGYTAKRQISPVRIDRSAIALTKGASPESIAHFDRIHRERKAKEERAMERNGDYGTPAGA